LDKQKTKILVIDDEKDIRDSLKDILNDEGYKIFLAANASEAKEKKLSEKIDLILLDIWMPDIDGLSLLKEWAGNNEINCPVIMMSGHGTIDTAIEATKIGATDFLEKPISLQKLLKTITSSLKNASIIKKIDKVFYSHMHADQTHGINDLRVFYIQNKKTIPVYADNPTKKYLFNTFKYCFINNSKEYPATLKLNSINDNLSISDGKKKT